jgi:hypothetical protein
VPAESQRLLRRVGARDRRFLAVVAGVAAIATPVAVVFSGSHPPSGCVTTTRAGFMGGQTYRYCGAAAVVACRTRAARDPSLAASCRRESLDAEALRP